MSNSEASSPQARPPGHAEAKALLLTVLAPIVCISLVLLLEPFRVAAAPTIYALPFVLAASLFLAVQLVRKGSARIPAVPAFLGLVWILGGGLLDMIATVVNTPTLELEANVIARALLDSGHSLSFVYPYAIVSQSLYL